MKRYAFLLILVLLPLLALAINNPYHFNKNSFGLHGKNVQVRSWRMLEYILESNSNGWQNNTKNVIYYNHNHPTAIDSVEGYDFDDQTNAWVLTTPIVYTYDSAWEYVVNITGYYTFGGLFRFPIYQEVVNYTPEHYISHISVLMIDMDTNVWMPMARMHLFYNNNNISSVYQWTSADDTDPASYSKRTFTFDGQGRIITETGMNSPDSTNWVNSEHVDRTYHPHDTTTAASFASNFSHYYPIMLTDDQSPIFGMVLQELDKSWDGSNWINDQKLDYQYDAQDHLTTLMDQDWNGLAWNDNRKDIYTYDTNGNMYRDLVQNWNDGSSSYVDYERTTYTWGETTANDDNTTPALSGLSMAAFPNPFNDKQSVKVYSRTMQPVQVKVFNIRGQEIYSTSILPNATFNWNTKAIPSGVYFMKAVQGDNTTTTKILKIK
ncbi:MAG TPA: T9SS type A sorting domain-containing protein [Candidatus Cloacimonadota bacterium]|nr:T9SS type A sorting domain-containing protein [Candidatus Cloacimonadota bacterium]HPT72383.1 T9SS type A sorting domain-containing protein [Candidatus Cloacimonadota bacterium]